MLLRIRWGRIGLLGWLAALCGLGGVLVAEAALESNISLTKHNFTSTPDGTALPTGGNVASRTVKSTTTSEVCVFCHTPHGSNTSAPAPLWNRTLSNETYTPYTSSTYDAAVDQSIPVSISVTGSSKLCLSCHDGTLAIGTVSNAPGSGNYNPTTGVSIGMSGTDAAADNGKDLVGGMPDGSGKTSGFTRDLGVTLENDHPISIEFRGSLATRDGELRAPGTGTNTLTGLYSKAQGFTTAVGVKGTGVLPVLRLEGTNQIQCGTCHDPHLFDGAQGNAKFLRARRFQGGAPSSATSFVLATDQICLACHGKGGWSVSAHAVTSTTQAYKDAAATQRDFPTGTQVYQAGCLNCHDTHTVQGARRLLREGTDSTATPKIGGNSAVEEVCYQCHRLRTDTDMVLNIGTQSVPDIRTDFTAGSSYHMPITKEEQCGGEEKHSIGDTGGVAGQAVALAGKDFLEKPELLGRGNANVACGSPSGNNRHAECTDCHNPHRVQKGNHAGGQGGTDIRGTANGNNISNALIGGWGVEPDYSGATTSQFGRIPAFPSTSLLCGTADSPNATTCPSGPVTKEYQICLKCHSNYAYDDVDGPSTAQFNYSGRPTMGGTGLTPARLTNLQSRNMDTNTNTGTFLWDTGAKYTNQAMEFWAPDSHKGECSNNTCTGTAPEPNPSDDQYSQPDHRSWHPVMQPTGRTNAERGGTIGTLSTPFNSAIGTQTMYCSDCHGNATGQSTNAPDANRPWGPHGSTNPFILKGAYDNTTNELCLKCHSAVLTAGRSGFCCDKDTNLHRYHAGRMGNVLRCSNCHVAVPHGWKHKALLADTLTVGNEVGRATEGNPGFTNAVGYTQGPYYLNAMLRVNTWRRSAQWTASDCNGDVGGMKSSCQNQ